MSFAMNRTVADTPVAVRKTSNWAWIGEPGSRCVNGFVWFSGPLGRTLTLAVSNWVNWIDVSPLIGTWADVWAVTVARRRGTPATVTTAVWISTLGRWLVVQA